MAGPGFARVVWTEHHFHRFLAAWNEASYAALAQAGELGKAAAVEGESRHVRTGATRGSIGFRLAGKNLMLFVGTLAGVFVEYGTKVRVNRGQHHPDPYLRPAILLAAKAVPHLVRGSFKGTGLFRHGSGRIQSRIGGRWGPGL